jgi:hypothetical protein
MISSLVLALFLMQAAPLADVLKTPEAKATSEASWVG